MSKFRSPFGCAVRKTGNYPTYSDESPHGGEDYVPTAKTEQNWKLFSPCNGKVYISKKQTGTYSGGYGAYGNYLVIIADDGKWVLMAHMKSVPSVKVGQRVSAGDFVGYAGETGNAHGRHLHIEVADMTGTAYDGATWYNLLVARRLKPSDYIDFGVPTPTPTPTPGGDFDMKTWTNGSTNEPVYSTVADCKAKSNQIGTIYPRERANCYGIEGGCYIVAYNAGATRKVGFVNYAGGVK